MELVREGFDMWDENFDYIHQDKNGNYFCEKDAPRQIIELTSYLNEQNETLEFFSNLLFGNQEDDS